MSLEEILLRTPVLSWNIHLLLVKCWALLTSIVPAETSVFLLLGQLLGSIQILKVE
jgi:hypothetical protein